jgi:DNA-binding response OmpR family regulator
MAHQAEEYVAAGMDGAVAKPIQLDQLLAAMEAVLQPAEPADPRAAQLSA